MNTLPPIRADFRVGGFTAYVNGEWTIPQPYKAVMIAYRRGREDKSAEPIQMTPGYKTERRRK